MRPTRELLCGVCGLGCLLATCVYAARPVEPASVTHVALMLPLSGEFSRDSRDMQRVAEFALKAARPRPTTLRVYNVRPYAAEPQGFKDGGTVSLFRDFSDGKADLIYGYQSTHQLRVGVDVLRESFGGARCEKKLTINTISVTTPMERDPGGCVVVEHRGGTNSELAATAAEFIVSQAASGVVFLYDRPDPYAENLVAETQIYLKTRHQWPASRIFDINDLEEGAPSSHSMTSVLFVIADPAEFRAQRQRARDAGFAEHCVLGGDSLLSREFLFSSAYINQNKKSHLYMLLPDSLERYRGFVARFREPENGPKRRPHKPGFMDGTLFDAIASDLAGVESAPHGPVTRQPVVVSWEQLRGVMEEARP